VDYKNPFIKKAVFTLVVGMAFLILSCQGGRMMQPERVLTGYSGAVADYEAGRYDIALKTFNGILRTAPDHPEIQMIKYYQAFCYYYTGDYKKSIDLSTEWMKDYPESPEQYRIQKLAGDAGRASGHMYDACFWMTVSLKTAKAADVPVHIQDMISGSISDVISQSDKEELEKIKQLDSIDLFLPSIYLREAELAFENGSYLEARRFTKLAVQSASEMEQSQFLTKGREFLTRINKAIDETSDINRRYIGCLLPLQGPFSLFGEELLNGIQLGMDIFNSSDTDVTLELIIRNTNGSPEDTITAMDDLILKEKVIAIIGPLASSASAEAAKRAQEYGVPIITFTQKQNITEEGDMVFRNFLTPSKEMDVLVSKAVNEMGMSRFGIFYSETRFGNNLMNLFWDKVEELGGEITAVESYKEGDTDFSEGIKKMIGLYYPRPESVFEMLKAKKMIKIFGEQPADPENSDVLSSEGTTGMPGDETADLPEISAAPDKTEEAGDGYMMFSDAEAVESQPGEDPDSEDPDAEQPDEATIEEEAMTDPIVDFDAVFIPDDSPNIALIAPQFPFNGIFNVPFLGTSGWLSNDFDLIGTTSDYLQGAMFPVGFYAESDSENVREFVRLYRDAYGKYPEFIAATGFDTIKMIKKLMTEKDILTRSDFQQALFGYDMYEGVTGRISFDDQGEVEKSPILLTVHGRRLHVLQ
jgi:ABC-type branched-subunit amino acid transport system substrate-binding protein